MFRKLEGAIHNLNWRNKKLKKKISIILTLGVIFTTLFSTTIYADDINVYIDRKIVELTDANGERVYPFIQNGTTYVPLRGISEILDCDVIWDGNNTTVLIYKNMRPDNSVFRNNSGEIKLYVDNQPFELKDEDGAIVKPFIENGTTYVPLRGVSKVLGYPVEWEGQTKSVYVWKNDVSPNGVTMDFLRPYEENAPVGGMHILYESDGETKEIDGIEYTNTILGIFGSASFNLDGKYDTLTCVLGYIPESTSEGEATILFIVDGKIVESFNVTQNSAAKKIKVNLNRGLKLKISFNPGRNFADIYAGLGDITFYAE